MYLHLQLPWFEIRFWIFDFDFVVVSMVNCETIGSLQNLRNRDSDNGGKTVLLACVSLTRSNALVMSGEPTVGEFSAAIRALAAAVTSSMDLVVMQIRLQFLLSRSPIRL